MTLHHSEIRNVYYHLLLCTCMLLFTNVSFQGNKSVFLTFLWQPFAHIVG